MFVLIGLISLGLTKAYYAFNPVSLKSSKCNSGELVPEKVVLFSKNRSATSTIKLFLKSENFEYFTYKEMYNLRDSEWDTISVKVPKGLEDYYLQKIKNSLIKEGLSSTDFNILRDSIMCLD